MWFTWQASVYTLPKMSASTFIPRGVHHRKILNRAQQKMFSSNLEKTNLQPPILENKGITGFMIAYVLQSQ
jgi:hypothetical protein